MADFRARRESPSELSEEVSENEKFKRRSMMNVGVFMVDFNGVLLIKSWYFNGGLIME